MQDNKVIKGVTKFEGVREFLQSIEVSDSKDKSTIVKQYIEEKVRVLVNSTEGVDNAVATDFVLEEYGMTNQTASFSIVGDDYSRRYVLRIPKDTSNYLVDRDRERQLYSALESAGLTGNCNGPWCSDDALVLSTTGIKISSYIESSGRKIETSEIIEVLKDLHSRTDLEVTHKFNFKDMIVKYLDLITETQSFRSSKSSHTDDEFKIIDYVLNSSSNDWISLYELSESIKKKLLDSRGEVEVLCHGDAHVDNFIVSPDGVFHLLDWEYSGYNHPVLDLAMSYIFTCEKYDGGVSPQDYLELYYDNPTMDHHVLMLCYTALGGYLWSLWSVYKMLQVSPLEMDSNVDLVPYIEDQMYYLDQTLEILRSRGDQDE